MDGEDISPVCTGYELLDTLPIGVVVLNEDYTVIYWNRILEKWTGISRNSIEHTPIQSKFPGMLTPGVLLRLQDVFTSGIPAVFSSQLHTRILPVTLPGGRMQIQNVTITPVLTPEGSYHALFAIEDVTDLTNRILGFRRMRDQALEEVAERKKAEEGLRVANKKLNLLSSITRHDILNQLTALLGFVGLAKEMVDDPELHEYLDISEKAANNIKRQVEFTRDYEDLGVKAPVWHRVEETVRAEAGSLKMGEITLETDLDGLMIYADPLFSKVFYNLIDNTIRYGEKTTKIRIYWSREGNNLRLIYVDDGVGVPVDKKERIFRRGFGKNTGLGLFLIREILDITGLSIKETGNESEGARFEIFIPDGAFRF
jgi:signal transduction histidine kinase